MRKVSAIDPDGVLEKAKQEEQLRGIQLLQAAQARYDGDMDEEEFNGFLCRYGHACLSRRVLLHDLTIEAANRSNLN
jgi:hypothetical protein